MKLNTIYQYNSLITPWPIGTKSVDCIVTSPPYWGLRDYGVAGQLGLEDTPEEYVAKMVLVFNEARRVLKPDGTLWLNLGDSYANDGKWGGSTGGKHAASLHGQTGIGRGKKKTGLKAKDLVGIPWMVAFALREAGWYLRQDIIWHKPNPMPESVTDRCTKAHEYLFLFSKEVRYYFDSASIQENRVQNEDANSFRGGSYCGSETDNATMGKRKIPGNKKHKAATAYAEGDIKHRTKIGLVDYADRERAADPNDLGKRNKRSVWTVGSSPFKEAHFATFPPALIVDCIKAGCPPGGVVFDPFMGAGTTALVSRKLGRNFIGLELNSEYINIAQKRLKKELGMFL